MPNLLPSAALQGDSRSAKAIRHLSIVVIAFILTFLTNQPDYDLWARLAVGSIFFQTGTIPKHDIFSYLPTKLVWIDHEWGSGVVLYALAKCCGEYGIFLLKGLLIYAILTTVLRTVELAGRKKAPGPLYFILLGYALFPGIASLVRSQMFTYLFFAVWLYGLECVRLERKKLLWLFPCTMLLWANLHGGFVAGIGLVLLYAVGEALNRRSPLPYLWILLAILPVTLINPYGPSYWKYVVEATLMERPLIKEWDPVSLRGPLQAIGPVKVHYLMGYLLLVGMTAATGLRAILRNEKPNWARIVALAVLFLVGVRHQRNVSFFVLASTALLYQQFDGLLDLLRALASRTFIGGLLSKHPTVHRSLGLVLPAIIFAILLPKLSYRMRVDYRRFPVGSFEFIKQNRISGNLATAFDWGSYALWKLYPQCKVLVDGRYEEVYPNDVFEAAMQLSEKQGQWWEVPQRFPTDVIVLSKITYTRADLSSFSDWKPVYQDFVSVVLVPKNRPVAFSMRPDFKDPAYGKEDLSRQIVLNGAAR